MLENSKSISKLYTDMKRLSFILLTLVRCILLNN